MWKAILLVTSPDKLVRYFSVLHDLLPVRNPKQASRACCGAYALVVGSRQAYSYAGSHYAWVAPSGRLLHLPTVLHLQHWWGCHVPYLRPAQSIRTTLCIGARRPEQQCSGAPPQDCTVCRTFCLPMPWLRVLADHNQLASQSAAERTVPSKPWSSRVQLFPHNIWFTWHTLSKKGCCMAYIWASRAADVQQTQL